MEFLQPKRWECVRRRTVMALCHKQEFLHGTECLKRAERAFKTSHVPDGHPHQLMWFTSKKSEIWCSKIVDWLSETLLILLAYRKDQSKPFWATIWASEKWKRDWCQNGAHITRSSWPFRQKLNSYHSTTTVFAWLSTMWLLAVLKTQKATPWTPFRDDWRDKRKNDEWAAGHTYRRLCGMFRKLEKALAQLHCNRGGLLWGGWYECGWINKEFLKNKQIIDTFCPQ